MTVTNQKHPSVSEQKPPIHETMQYIRDFLFRSNNRITVDCKKFNAIVFNPLSADIISIIDSMYKQIQDLVMTYRILALK